MPRNKTSEGRKVRTATGAGTTGASAGTLLVLQLVISPIPAQLSASAFISIVKALGDDVNEIAEDVQDDEQKIIPLFDQIDAFSKKMSK